MLLQWNHESAPFQTLTLATGNRLSLLFFLLFMVFAGELLEMDTALYKDNILLHLSMFTSHLYLTTSLSLLSTDARYLLF